MPPIPELAQAVEQMPFFDTHSHAAGFDFGTPLDDRQGKSLPQVLMNDYLAYLSGSCWDQSLQPAKAGGWQTDDAREHFAAILPLLDQYRALTTYAALREGIRELYPFTGHDITQDNFDQINQQMVAAYRSRGERAWHREVCARAGIVRQNQMCFLPYVTDHWDSLPADERERQRALIAPSLVLDGYIFSGFSNNRIAWKRSLELTGSSPRTHSQYLEFCAKVLDCFKDKGGWSVKILAAYMRPLRFEEAPDAVAAPLLARALEHGPTSLDAGELRLVQDNLMWHLLELAHQRRLPLIVHCGYSWPTTDADAQQLMNLMTSPRLRGLKIDICHSNWPNEGKAMILARTYRGAYFNLCWTPLLSYDLGRRILSESIDMMPRNKVLIGTDCGSIESMLGTTRMLRRLLVDVLSEKVEQHRFSLDVALAWARAILYDNPLEFYGCNPRDPQDSNPAAPVNVTGASGVN